MLRKSVCVVVLWCILLLPGCSAKAQLEKFQTIHEQEQPVYNAYPVKVFCVDQIYAVVILSNDNVAKGAEFSIDRSALTTMGIDLISIDNIRNYLGMTLDNVVSDFGRYHVDVGSGGFMPSYLTTDGFMIVFSVNRDSQAVERVAKMDLFTGESIEWYYSEP